MTLPWKPPPTSIRPRQPTMRHLPDAGRTVTPYVCMPTFKRRPRAHWSIHFLTWQGSTWRRIWHLWPAALLLLWWLL